MAKNTLKPLDRDCCNGDLRCSLNKITRTVNIFWEIVETDPEAARYSLREWILTLEDDIDNRKFTIEKLKRKLSSKST